MSRIVCGTHGHCFDGASSAALFHAWMHRRDEEVEFLVRGFGYGPTQARPTRDLFIGDVNVVLDYRYDGFEELSAYFDHHQTAFPSDSARNHFERNRTRFPDRFVYDAHAPSCTGLLYRHLVALGVFSREEHRDLVEFAEIVDSARFASAAEATDLDDARIALVHVVERFGDDDLLAELVPCLATESLERVANAAFVRERFVALRGDLGRYEKAVGEVARLEHDVVFLDLTGAKLDAFAKFVQYREFPEARYSVILTCQGGGVKVSIGYNPWSERPCHVDIGGLCEEFGGGGHFVVGAAAFPKDRLDDARRAARIAVERLK